VAHTQWAIRLTCKVFLDYRILYLVMRLLSRVLCVSGEGVGKVLGFWVSWISGSSRVSWELDKEGSSRVSWETKCLGSWVLLGKDQGYLGSQGVTL
jgi:hypothetical protein